MTCVPLVLSPFRYCDNASYRPEVVAIPGPETLGLFLKLNVAVRRECCCESRLQLQAFWFSR
jgi:hypothetical protein